MNKRTTLVAGLLLIAAPAAFAATVVNGNFETGTLAGWSSIGLTYTTDGTFGSGPLAGSYSGFMDTSGGADSLDVDTFFGFAAGTIDSFCTTNVTDCEAATNGSAIKQTIFANAGEVLTFQYRFFTDELVPSVFNDFAAVVFNGIVFVADTHSAPFTASSSPFDEEQVGILTLQVTTTTTGLQDLGFMVFNEGDTGFQSGFMVDSITVTAAPEPTSLTLLAIGLAGVGVARRFKLIR